MIVRKCCFCCSLKYGFLTWAIINLLFRFMIAFSFFFGQHFYGINSNIASVISSASGSAFGWEAASILILIAAIKGIMEKRYLLIYPYIIVLIVEIIVLLFATICLAIWDTPWHILEFFLILIINGYTILCLISLYRIIKQDSKARRQAESIPFKTV